ncbi:MAG TPA: c-type cytochrome [Candidatus Acidoferrales bacterium]|nr:c-type cytochrome [Candidatus Acidoferrales bacterium]
MRKEIWAAVIVMIVALTIGSQTQRANASGSRHARVTPSAQSDADLVAKGKASYDGYGCYDCHGAKGEGSSEGPSLIESKLTAEEVAKTLKNPSADARSRGMPVIPPDSPDLPGLVAFVMSLRKPATAAASVTLDLTR